MAKQQYSEMTNEELTARIEELEDELRESWEETICCGGRFHTDGIYKNWWSDQCLSSVRGAIHYLVKAGFWELHPGNDGFARPIEKDRDNA